jgi:hypothetical protein
MNLDRILLPLRMAVILHATAAKGHDSTLHKHEAARDRVEARLLGAGVALGMLAPALPTDTPACRVSLKLVDEKSSRPVSGLVRVTQADGTVVPLTGLVNRGVGLRPDHPGRQWFALLEAATVILPREELRVESIAGLEYERASAALDLRGKETAELTLALKRFVEPALQGWRSGNTHLHLRGLSRTQADEYLRAVSRADDLEILFVSHLKRAKEDSGYITNSYTPEEVRSMSNEGVQFGWGQEHRNNFGGFNEGYGHVMLLNLKRLIEPVSIGPGITGSGFDFPPLRQGMEEARRENGTVLWCHNVFGFEDVPNWLDGRVDALNIFDGGTRGSYAESYYRFLNVGLKVPFSTGTDWFIYDFSRVYVRMNEKPSEPSWLSALEEGKTFITNGPLLEFGADGREIGDTIALDAERSINISGRATGRTDFGTIELVHNGAVIAEAKSRAVGGHFEADLKFSLRVDAPGWTALRAVGRSVASDVAPVPSPPVSHEPHNEMDEPLFAHTSPIYLEFAGRTVFLSDAARSLIANLEASQAAIQEKGHFANEAQREQVVAIYREGAAKLRRKLK